MLSAEEFTRYKELKSRLTDTNTDVISPNLGKGRHLHFLFLRISFVAKVIDYLAGMYIFSNISKLEGDIILSAVCKSSWMLSYLPTYNSLLLLLNEMAVGLELLNREDLGYEEVENPAFHLDNNKPKYIKRHLGYNYSLSDKGILSYQRQEYQILYANLLSANINRFVSYAAVIIAFVALIVTLCK
ncbi:hypothetical protein [Xylanibacter muris]|uniref:hypothetical protein n=1 Tax=Xylanibacter muris TaxID=2736290 RepID=UPI0025A0FA81|nr:hypothetical protein [Xylanibacter muris]